MSKKIRRFAPHFLPRGSPYGGNFVSQNSLLPLKGNQIIPLNNPNPYSKVFYTLLYFKKRRILLYLILGVGILFFFYKAINIDEFFSSLSKVSIGLLILLGVAQLITQTLLAYKWRLLIKRAGHKITFIKVFAINLAGAFIENITPAARLGNEPTQTYLLCKEGAPLKDALAIAALNNYLGILPFIILSFLSFLYIAREFTLPLSLTITIFTVLVILIALLALGIILYKRDNALAKVLYKVSCVIQRFKGSYQNNNEADIINMIDNFKVSVREIMRHKAILVQSLFVSIVIWVLYPLKIYLIFYAMGSDVTFGLVASVTFMAYLTGMIPALPGGVGVYEGSAILLYSIMGIPLHEATAAVLIGRAFTFGMVSLMGMFATIGLTRKLLLRSPVI
jgi:uncharacterized protein (TIRG00374 family)